MPPNDTLNGNEVPPLLLSRRLS